MIPIKVLPHKKYARNQPIIPVLRESEPIVQLTDKKHYWMVPFWINFFLVKVFLTDCQLNKIGNILLSCFMVNLMILYLLFIFSINCRVYVAFKTQLESPEKTLATLKSLGVKATIQRNFEDNFLEQQGLSRNAICSRKRCHLLKFYTYNLQKPT